MNDSDSRLLEALPDAACLLDGGLRVAVCNRAWRRLTGEAAAGAQAMGRASGQAKVVAGRGAAAEDGLARGAVQMLYVARVDASCLLAILRPAAEGASRMAPRGIGVCDAGGRL